MNVKLIIGLRNPGANYEATRHNAGGWFVERLAQSLGFHFKVEKKLHCELAHYDAGHHSYKIALPLTFMNHSGIPARAISQFYRIEPHEILVVHDDLDLPAGRIKLKIAGGHGGHNGLKDITAHLGTTNFHRLRIGIGHPGLKELVLHYVLGKPSQQEKQLIDEAIDRGIAIMPTLFQGSIAIAMNKLNG